MIKPALAALLGGAPRELGGDFGPTGDRARTDASAADKSGQEFVFIGVPGAFFDAVFGEVVFKDGY